MARTTRKLVLILLGLVAIVGSVAMYKVYCALYDETLEPGNDLQFKVEELQGTHPTRLHIVMQPLSSAIVLRTITTKTRNQTLIVLAHGGLAGVVEPNSNWGRTFELAVPDSVNEVRFGHSKTLVWKRGSALSPPTERH
jgi:hypothetical protein